MATSDTSETGAYDSRKFTFLTACYPAVFSEIGQDWRDDHILTAPKRQRTQAHR